MEWQCKCILYAARFLFNKLARTDELLSLEWITWAPAAFAVAPE